MLQQWCLFKGTKAFTTNYSRLSTNSRSCPSPRLTPQLTVIINYHYSRHVLVNYLSVYVVRTPWLLLTISILLHPSPSFSVYFLSFTSYNLLNPTLVSETAKCELWSPASTQTPGTMCGRPRPASSCSALRPNAAVFWSQASRVHQALAAVIYHP